MTDYESGSADDVEEENAPQISVGPLPGNPKILARDEHPISRRNIDPDAMKVMYRLNQHGYHAFLVGGGVRDLMLGKTPKDFDLGTDARPEAVRALFRNSRVIGRRFRLNHVFFRGNKIIEVATFRASKSEDEEVEMLSHDNTYGDAESDAFRRDLTINGLFYDLRTCAIIDYVNGIDDLNNKIIRMIGDPDIRFQEDPVRMIRAIRHAARTGFTIEQNTYDAIVRHAALLSECPIARIYEEFVREMREGYAVRSIGLLHETGLLRVLMPYLDERLRSEGEEKERLLNVLRQLDEAVQEGREIPVTVLFLALSLEQFAVESSRERAHLSNMIEDLFRPLGVSKRDREEMEHVILTAFMMFSNFRKPRRSQENVLRRAAAWDALFLIELTANNDAGRECVQFWSSLRREMTRVERAPQRNRRRRRNPRRRQ